MHQDRTLDKFKSLERLTVTLLLASDAGFFDRRVEWCTLAIISQQKEVAWGATLNPWLTEPSIIVVVSCSWYILFYCISNLFCDLALSPWMENWALAMSSFYGDVLPSYALKSCASTELTKPGSKILAWSWGWCESQALRYIWETFFCCSKCLRICSPVLWLKLVYSLQIILTRAYSLNYAKYVISSLWFECGCVTPIFLGCISA